MIERTPVSAVNTARLQDGHYYPTGTRTRWPAYHADDGHEEDLRRLPEPDPAHVDELFLSDLPAGWYAVTNTRLGVGFAMRYPADVFKQLWYWQVYRGGRDYPWWSATYNIALEPCATLPVLSHAAARGEALTLGPGESQEIELTAMAFEGSERVSSVSAEGVVNR